MDVGVLTDQSTSTEAKEGRTTARVKTVTGHRKQDNSKDADGFSLLLTGTGHSSLWAPPPLTTTPQLTHAKSGHIRATKTTTQRQNVGSFCCRFRSPKCLSLFLQTFSLLHSELLAPPALHHFRRRPDWSAPKPDNAVRLMSLSSCIQAAGWRQRVAAAAAAAAAASTAAAILII